MKTPVLSESRAGFPAAALLLFCIHPHIASSENATAQTKPLNTRVTRPTAEDTVTQKAARWGLNVDEWQRYLSLMEGPLGIQSPGLDPVTALGIEARTDAERQRYAKLQVQLETRRVEKILAYQRAYDAEFRRLHPNLRRVDVLRDGLAGTTTTEPPADAARIALFVKRDCAPCDHKVKSLIRGNTSFDIYLVGSRNDDAVIRDWAKNAGVDPARVRTGAITLNHDSGRWLSLGERGELPALVRNVNGRWVRM